MKKYTVGWDVYHVIRNSYTFGTLPSHHTIREDELSEVTSIDISNLLAPMPNLSFLKDCPRLTKLNVSGRALGKMPELPDSLIHLDLSFCHVKRLPSELPPNLMLLEVSGNRDLKKLPPLPSTLKRLVASRCALTELPPLPDSLIHIDVSDNPVERIDRLPDRLAKLICVNTNVKTLPALPDKLHTLECNTLEWLPNLPPNTSFESRSYLDREEDQRLTSQYLRVIAAHRPDEAVATLLSGMLGPECAAIVLRAALLPDIEAGLVRWHGLTARLREFVSVLTSEEIALIEDVIRSNDCAAVCHAL